MRIAATLALLAALLVACADAERPPPAPFGVPTASPTTAAAQPQTAAEIELFGPRVELPGGLLYKQLGKVVQYGGPDDEDLNTWAVRLVVDKIEVDPQCNDYVELLSGRAHRIVVTLRLETNAAYDPAVGSPQFFAWSTIGPDGVSEGAAGISHSCRSEQDLPFELRPSAQYRGEVTYETDNPVGRLVLIDWFTLDYPSTAAYAAAVGAVAGR